VLFKKGARLKPFFEISKRAPNAGFTFDRSRTGSLLALFYDSVVDLGFCQRV
jgi:hypothetical protein